jgi:hypothetical protein
MYNIIIIIIIIIINIYIPFNPVISRATFKTEFINEEDVLGEA